MPTKFYEPEPEKPSKPKRLCDGLREDLKNCLVNSDCVQKHGMTPKQCLMLHDDPSVPDECVKLRMQFFECKRSMLDMRNRFRGKKGYWSTVNCGHCGKDPFVTRGKVSQRCCAPNCVSSSDDRTVIFFLKKYIYRVVTWYAVVNAADIGRCAGCFQCWLVRAISVNCYVHDLEWRNARWTATAFV